VLGRRNEFGTRLAFVSQEAHVDQTNLIQFVGQEYSQWEKQIRDIPMKPNSNPLLQDII